MLYSQVNSEKKSSFGLAYLTVLYMQCMWSKRRIFLYNIAIELYRVYRNSVKKIVYESIKK